MIQVPIIINCRDRITHLAKLVSWLEKIGQERIYLLDNDSTYPNLLDYYAQSPHQVIKLNENIGHNAPWVSGTVNTYCSDFYIVSDPDIVPIEACPDDAIDFFYSILQRYNYCRKIGFGLSLDDIPESYAFKSQVLKWEKQFWQYPLEHMVFSAPVDTTFALYRPGTTSGIEASLRTGHPYTARHTSWYIDSKNLTEEEQYYRANAKENESHWSRDELPTWFKRLLGE